MACVRGYREKADFSLLRTLQKERKRKGMDSPDPTKWTVDDVCLWILTLDDHEFMLPHVERFKAARIDGVALLQLTDDALRDEMGMAALGHRKKLLLRIDAIRADGYPVNSKGKRRRVSTGDDTCGGSGEAEDDTVEVAVSSSKRQKVTFRAAEKVCTSSGGGTVSEHGDDATSTTLALPFTCPICYGEFHKVEDVASLSNCGHKTCAACIQGYLQQRIDDRALPIICPHRDCGSECAAQDVAAHVEQRYIDRWEQFSLDDLLKNKHLVEGQDELRFVRYPTPDCSNIVLWHPEDDPHFRCESCRKHYCLKCQCAFHHGRTCIGYKKWKISTGRDDRLFLRYISQQRVKQCPQCGMFIEKSVGCNSMTCFCGFTFCFYCGKPEATCLCGGAHHYMPPNESWGDETD